MVMIFLENSNIELRKSRCFFTNLEWVFGTCRVIGSLSKHDVDGSKNVT